jgi:DNA-binding CsgD family transcriptional regulator
MASENKAIESKISLGKGSAQRLLAKSMEKYGAKNRTHLMALAYSDG